MLDGWKERLAGGPQVGRSDHPPLARLKGVCRQQQLKVLRTTPKTNLRLFRVQKNDQILVYSIRIQLINENGR